MRFICAFLFLLLYSSVYSQDVTQRKILDDGTMVKFYSNGDMEIRFSEGKAIVSTYITEDGEVKTEYSREKTGDDQEPPDDGNDQDLQDERRIQAPGEAEALLSADLSQLDDSTRQVFKRARMQYFNYFIEGYKHRQNVFHWQLLSSKIIFIVVVLLVFSGIIFAAIQFYDGLKNSLRQTSQTTTFEAGKGGLKVSSPILGVIILVISLVFFYLYLVYVYPIKEIF